jgi:uncharacterized protein YcfJ
MKLEFKSAFALAGIALAAQAGAQVTFYESESYAGRSFTAQGEVQNLQRQGFNDRASSAVVQGNRWEVCEDSGFRGRCVVLRPGQYPSLTAMGLDNRISSVREVAGNARGDDDRYPQSDARITFFEQETFAGRSFGTRNDIDDFRSRGFNDRASSVVVKSDRWEVCDDINFRGRCVVLRPGQYPSLSAMGLDNRISSVREVAGNARVDNRRYAPAAPDFRRRQGERLYQADVTGVRMVAASGGQRCWMEREAVPQEQRGGANVPGALVGAVLGGIIGHQIGGGTGRDIATVGGAVVGGAVGSNVGRGDGGGPVQARDVQRCAPSAGPVTPAYWDVTYTFRGQEHRAQMVNEPGATITVNRQGEPRG